MSEYLSVVQALTEKVENLETQILLLEQSNRSLQKDKLSLELNEAKILDIQRLALIYSWEVNLVSCRLKGSEQLLEIIGKNEDEKLLIDDLFGIVHPDDIELFEEIYDEAVSQETAFEFIHRLVFANGEERIVKHYLKTFFLANGMPFKSMGLMQDITDLKQAEDNLNDAISNANAASRAKSDFLANMSHELRTPLNGILGYAQILERSPALADKERYGVNIIHQCGSHLLTLINDVLDLAKIEACKLELLPSAQHLPTALQSIVDICRIKAEQKGVQFYFEPSTRLPEGVLMDEKRLRQVLINLLGNAIKFTDQGSVTLRVEVLNLSGRQASLLFQIIDTGVGIAPADCAKLFEAFEQVGQRQRQAEGTGLGLAISQRIVKLMGSTIQVDSQLGQGSEFYFAIDVLLAEDGLEQPISINHHQKITGYQGERRQILVVDDRWENRIVFVELLTPLGFKVIEAENGKHGLEQLQENSVDLVILDLAMPVMDGYQMLQQLRHTQAFANLVVIVSSASVSHKDENLALEAGGDAFLPKPIDCQDLFGLIAEHLQLDWIYETPDIGINAAYSENLAERSALVVPSARQLQQLIDCASSGVVRNLRQELNQLVETDAKYAGFVRPLLALAQQFKVEEIEGMLKAYLSAAEITE